MMALRLGLSVSQPGLIATTLGSEGLGIPSGQMHHIIISVVSQGLVRETDQGSDQPGRCYEITRKGENVLRYFSQVEEIEEISNVARAH